MEVIHGLEDDGYEARQRSLSLYYVFFLGPGPSYRNLGVH